MPASLPWDSSLNTCRSAMAVLSTTRGEREGVSIDRDVSLYTEYVTVTSSNSRLFSLQRGENSEEAI